ncbi:GspMb/PilO family protein [Roseateles sp. UC29_93]|uniref:GspMb/PilO family protein n=1 Tax=Roseateles sp. UC29_93 TaxID=3350177 RepID=UPI00366F3BBA
MRLTSIDWRALTDPATLKQRLSRAPTAVWVGVALVPPLVAGALLVVARQAEHLSLAHEQATRTELAALRAKAAAAPAADVSPFAARLPLTQSSARAVTHLREAAESQSVLVTSISTAHQAPTASTLGRMSLDVNLRGSYAAIKTVLAELLTRDAQQAVLQQISMRRAPGTAPQSGGRLRADERDEHDERHERRAPGRRRPGSPRRRHLAEPTAGRPAVRCRSCLGIHSDRRLVDRRDRRGRFGCRRCFSRHRRRTEHRHLTKRQRRIGRQGCFADTSDSRCERRSHDGPLACSYRVIGVRAGAASLKARRCSSALPPPPSRAPPARRPRACVPACAGRSA